MKNKIRKIFLTILSITSAMLGMLCLYNNLELCAIPGFIIYSICLYRYDYYD